MAMMELPPIVSQVLVVAGVILALPLIIAWTIFFLGITFAPEDAEGNAERGGEVIVRAVENSLPAWTDPVGWFLAVCLAGLLVFAWRAYQHG